MTSIENLSNELFHDIFDYLDGCEIFLAFSNLNQRFHQLLHSSFLLLKIQFNIKTVELYNDICRQIVLLNKQQIFSVQLVLLPHIHSFISSLTIDSSFNRLEAINIQQIPPDFLKPFLIKLASLPRLSLLTIHTWNAFKNLNEIYRLIFALPMLKYNQFALIEDDCSVTLPMATKKQFSTIEYLDMVHSCTFNEIARLVSYTPDLNHLSIFHTAQNDSINGVNLSITLSKLTYLSIYGIFIPFDRLEMFIKNIHCVLKVLHVITRSEDINYLNADRWERLILQNLPQLEELKFQYYEQTTDSNKSSTYLGGPNQFTSPFWIARKWVFFAEAHGEHVIYSIRPYKKRWYEDAQPTTINSSLQLSKSAQLTFIDLPPYDCYHLALDDIESVFIVAQIYHLIIEKKPADKGTLIAILTQLREVVSLKIHSLSSEKLTEQQGEYFLDVSDECKITKICLEEMNNIDEVDFLMCLSPPLNYLQINSLPNVNIESFIREILIRINDGFNEDLRFLCFRVPTADDQLIEKLKEMIDSEEALVDYTIKRVNDKIYLQRT